MRSRAHILPFALLLALACVAPAAYADIEAVDVPEPTAIGETAPLVAGEHDADEALGAHAQEPLAAAAQANESGLPARFDAREQGWVPAFVRQQNPWGSCWAISALEAIETNLVKQGKADAGLTLSPRHLLMFAGTALPAAGQAVVANSGVQAGQAAAQAGEGQHPVEWMEAAHGANAPFELGGNFYVVYQALASGYGPLLESQAPYRNDEGLVEYGQDGLWYAPEGTWALPESMRFAQGAVQLREAVLLPSPASFASSANLATYSFDSQAVQAIKQAIVDYGSVAIAYDSNEAYYDPRNKTVFTTESRLDNHGVQVVGWDDSVSRRLFTTGGDGALPEGDGAWIVRNSYGAPGQGFPNESSWSDDGYFYLSYYDRSAQAFAAYDVMLPSDPQATDVINQHDFLGQMGQASSRIQSTDTSMMSANVFVAECAQALQAVSVDTYAPDSDVTVEVYLLDADAVWPDEGQLLERVHTSFAQAGYHRVQLQEAHEVSQGQRFSVVQRVLEPTADGGAVAVASIEAGNSPQAASRYGYYHYDTVVANEGESFVFGSLEDGGQAHWMDAVEVGSALTGRSAVATPYGNVMIKVFSRKLADSKPQPDPEPEPAPDPQPSSEPSSGPSSQPNSQQEATPAASTASSESLRARPASAAAAPAPASTAAHATPATGDATGAAGVVGAGCGVLLGVLGLLGLGLLKRLRL